MNSFELPGDFRIDEVDLRNSHVLVTGASSEIGSAVSRACARAGATVLMMDRKARLLDPVYDHIVNHGGPEPIAVAFDFLKSNDNDLDNLAQTVGSSIDQLQGLAHCAQWGAPLTPVLSSDLQSWQNVIHNQFLLPLALTRHLMPLLTRAETASVVFTTMDIGRRGRAYWGIPGAACAATENLVQVWGDESESVGVRFNSIDPGKVKTGLRQKFYPAESSADLRPADDETLLAHYLYLLGEESRSISGRQLTVPALEET